MNETNDIHERKWRIWTDKTNGMLSMACAHKNTPMSDTIWQTVWQFTRQERTNCVHPNGVPSSMTQARVPRHPHAADSKFVAYFFEISNTDFFKIRYPLLLNSLPTFSTSAILSFSKFALSHWSSHSSPKTFILDDEKAYLEGPHHHHRTCCIHNQPRSTIPYLCEHPGLRTPNHPTPSQGLLWHAKIFKNRLL